METTIKLDVIVICKKENKGKMRYDINVYYKDRHIELNKSRFEEIFSKKMIQEIEERIVEDGI